MSEEKYFLEAINASEPNADLVYADWLEEQGRPEADEIRDQALVVLCKWFFWHGSACGSLFSVWYGISCSASCFYFRFWSVSSFFPCSISGSRSGSHSASNSASSQGVSFLSSCRSKSKSRRR